MSSSQINTRKTLWTIGGGKGGSGKSFLTTNIGISLSKLGAQVILVDADLGGANLHTLLGVSPPFPSLADFIQKKVQNLQDLLISPGIPKLKLLSGTQDLLNSADVKSLQRRKLLRAIRALGGDYILVDLGGGNAASVLDLFFDVRWWDFSGYP